MKTKITIGLILLFNLHTVKSQDTTQDSTLETQHRAFQISFVPWFGTSDGPDGKYKNNISFNVIAGYEYGFEGLELGGFYNINQSNIKGAQFSGFGNTVGGNINGFQAAGFVNTVKGKVFGTQMAGFSNIVTNDIKASQFSGFGNIVKGNVQGAQLAGFVNVTTQKMTGTQLAGFVNVSKEVKGTQVAGFTNWAENVNGTQVSGFVNKAKYIKGNQIGIINIADSLTSGVAFGLLNFVKNGIFQFAAEHNDVMDAKIALRTGTKSLYTILAVGMEASSDYTWSYGAGLGTQVDIKNNIYTNIELTTHVINTESNHFDELNLLSKLNLNFGKQLAEHLSLNFGPTLNLYITREYDRETRMYGSPGLQKKSFFSEIYSGTQVSMWVGYSASLKF